MVDGVGKPAACLIACLDADRCDQARVRKRAAGGFGDLFGPVDAVGGDDDDIGRRGVLLWVGRIALDCCNRFVPECRHPAGVGGDDVQLARCVVELGGELSTQRAVSENEPANHSRTHEMKGQNPAVVGFIRSSIYK